MMSNTRKLAASVNRLELELARLPADSQAALREPVDQLKQDQVEVEKLIEFLRTNMNELRFQLAEALELRTDQTTP